MGFRPQEDVSGAEPDYASCRFDHVPTRDEILEALRAEGKGAYEGFWGRLSIDFDWYDMAKTYRGASGWQDLPNPADAVKKIFAEKVQGSFVTIRLGRKWGDILAPHDHLDINIIPDRDKPHEALIIGWASVESVTKKLVTLLTPEELLLNVGAKTIHDVCEAMTAVYRKPVTYYAVDPSVVTVIRMHPSAFFPPARKNRKTGRVVHA